MTQDEQIFNAALDEVFASLEGVIDGDLHIRRAKEMLSDRGKSFNALTGDFYNALLAWAKENGYDQDSDPDRPPF